jgi:hypothetical protein
MTTPDGGQGATDTGQSAGGTGTQQDPNAIDPAGQSAGAQTQPAPEAEPTVSRKDFEALRAQLQASSTVIWLRPTREPSRRPRTWRHPGSRTPSLPTPTTRSSGATRIRL